MAVKPESVEVITENWFMRGVIGLQDGTCVELGGALGVLW